MTKVPFIPVREAMTANPVRIDGLATVAEALTRMRELDVNSLVVDRRDAHDEFGLLLTLDIALEVIAKNRATERTNVYEVMTKPAVTLHPEMNIRYAVRLLTRLGLSHALVMEGRELVGVVTLRDLAFRHLDAVEGGGGRR